MTVHDRAGAMRRKLLTFGATALAVVALGSVALSPAVQPVGAAESTAQVSNPGTYIRGNSPAITSADQTQAVSTYVVIGPGGVQYGPDGTRLPETAVANYVIGSTPSSAGPVFTISTPTPVVAPDGGNNLAAIPTPTAPGNAPRQQFYIGALDATSVYVPPPTLTPTPGSFIAGAAGAQPSGTPLFTPQTFTPPGSSTPVSGTPVFNAPASGPSVSGTSVSGTAVSGTQVSGTAVSGTQASSTQPFSPQPTIDSGNNPNVVIGTASGGVSSSGAVVGNGRGGTKG